MSRARPRIEVIGHSGAGAYAPPNSEASIRAALAIGVDRIELDLLRTADGTLVLHHDDQITTPDGVSHRIAALPWPELRQRAPDLLTLDAAADLIGGRRPLLLDAKRPGSEPAIADAVTRHGWRESALVSSTHALTLHRLHRRLPGLRLGLSTGHWAGSAPPPLLRPAVRLGFHLLLPPLLPPALALSGASHAILRHEAASAPLVALLHRRHWKIYLFTLDDPTAIRRAARLGVDGIISNRPDLVRRLLADEGRITTS